MDASIDELLARGEKRIGPPVLTALASDDPDEKPFLLEALAAAAALFLFEYFCGAYLDGLGLGEAAERHGRASRKLLARLRGGRGKAPTSEEKRHLAEGIEEIRRAPASEVAPEQAEAAVRDVLIESGVGRARAEDLARDIATLVVPEHDG
ncbi:MAG TPA: hypothetical protein VLK89_01140 [Solirubrobacterales bacterium]|nr:hypothetical protein [Solirubrobacterales bacterium]